MANPRGPDQEVPGSCRKRKGGMVMTYSDNIPRFSPQELGIEGLPVPDARRNVETRFFGKVTVKGLLRRHFDEQIHAFNEMTEREQIDHVQQVAAIRHKEREIRFATEIQHHPHVMKTCCFVCQPSPLEADGDDIRAIVMEYAPGGTAEEYLEMNPGLNDAKAYKWALQLARTMAYFHETCGIMHRDIRPANVFVFENGDLIKLGNFGFATRTTGNQQMSCRHDPNIVYSAPEVIGETSLTTYGFSADVWSFGAFLYYITHMNPDETPRVPFTITRLDAARSFRKRLEDGERPILDQDLHPVFVHLINECIKLEVVSDDSILNPRMTFAQIVDYLERNKGDFDVEESL